MRYTLKQIVTKIYFRLRKLQLFKVLRYCYILLFMLNQSTLLYSDNSHDELEVEVELEDRFLHVLNFKKISII